MWTDHEIRPYLQVLRLYLWRDLAVGVRLTTVVRHSEAISICHNISRRIAGAAVIIKLPQFSLVIDLNISLIVVLNSLGVGCDRPRTKSLLQRFVAT